MNTSYKLIIMNSSTEIISILQLLGLPNEISSIILSLKYSMESNEERDFQIKRFYFYNFRCGWLNKYRLRPNNIFVPWYTLYDRFQRDDQLFFASGIRNKGRYYKNKNKNLYRLALYRDILMHDKQCYPHRLLRQPFKMPFCIGEWMNPSEYLTPGNNHFGIPTMIKDIHHYHKLCNKNINQNIITLNHPGNITPNPQDETEEYDSSRNIYEIKQNCLGHLSHNCESCSRIFSYKTIFLERMFLLD